jgi:hypothetical protein
MRSSFANNLTRGILAGTGIAAAAYAACVGFTWYRYGHVETPGDAEANPLLDRFLPRYDVVERHSIRVDAPAAITLAAAREQDLQESPIIRAIFKAREIALGSTLETRPRPRHLIDELISLGWGILAEVPDREIVLGAVTKPWEANVVFKSIPAADFADFATPGFVKIIVSLRADAVGDRSIFRTETRAIATDGESRAKFRRYWSFVAPGVALIRRMSLEPVRRDAERRARALVAVASN